jgi:hypothetical protein
MDDKLQNSENILDRLIEKYFPDETKIDKNFKFKIQNREIYNKDGKTIGYVITIMDLIVRSRAEKNKVNNFLIDYASKKYNPERKVATAFADINEEYPSIVYMIGGNKL